MIVSSRLAGCYTAVRLQEGMRLIYVQLHSRFFANQKMVRKNR